LSATIVVITPYSSLSTGSQFLYGAKNSDANRTLIGRRFTRAWDTKGDKPAGSAGRAQAARRQRRLRIHKGRRKQAEKDVVDLMKRGRRGSGAGVSAGVPEAGVRSLNNRLLRLQ
jgi:hypothetical protein